jgi:hypothetical protein
MAKAAEPKKVDLHADAWSRFEQAIDVVAKSPPQHRTKSKAKKRRKVRSVRRRVSSAKPKSA